MTIARSTGNVLIVATYEILWDVLDHVMTQMVHSLGYDAGLPYHRKLIEAIEARDEHRAILTMKAHIENNQKQFAQWVRETEQGGKGEDHR